jgi:membrane-bound metal-dependent hydrolase YbcI (DUF457 family)
VDNLAHALVGAALGRAVAARRVPASGWIGAIAANAPDWSELVIGRNIRGSVGYYGFHRSITHSFVGAVIETVGIAALVWVFVTLGQRKRGIPVSLGWIVALVGVTVLSHLYLDWQGSYGLRPFLPWSGHWYYADWVAIVDPLYWLIPLVALAWGAERHWRDLVPIVLLAALICVLLLLRAAEAATWLLVVSYSIIAIGAVGWVAHWFGVARRQRAAAWAIALLAVYAGAQGIASRGAKADAQRAAVARFGSRAQSAALTRIGIPFQWPHILASADSVAGPDWAIPRHLNDPWVRRALSESPNGRAFGDFARFLAAEVDSAPTGITVTLRDARYALPPETGWGVITVEFATSASRGVARD